MHGFKGVRHHPSGGDIDLRDYSATVCLFLGRRFGNLTLNWPKLLQPFKTRFLHLISMCMCSRCDSTSLPVQRSQMKKIVF